MLLSGPGQEQKYILATIIGLEVTVYPNLSTNDRKVLGNGTHLFHLWFQLKPSLDARRQSSELSWYVLGSRNIQILFSFPYSWFFLGCDIGFLREMSTPQTLNQDPVMTEAEEGKAFGSNLNFLDKKATCPSSPIAAWCYSLGWVMATWPLCLVMQAYWWFWDLPSNLQCIFSLGKPAKEAFCCLWLRTWTYAEFSTSKWRHYKLWA